MESVRTVSCWSMAKFVISLPMASLMITCARSRILLRRFSTSSSAGLGSLLMKKFMDLVPDVFATPPTDGTGQCRWHPEGRRYPAKSLKERLRYIPDAVHAIDFVSSAPTSVNDMDTTSAGISSLANPFPH
ncbi:hypothetical protein HU200_012623 [Digitaria exilis]|uniref:Uncharacterized protein n=1 Tax=Digitaria exilis TaxID=1010633 RepID=A0A835FFC6_9POAL|nr:hypothetical protein HU200_012623 [Digitaria exilis]